MIDLSAVVITKNEAKRIQRCLESIRWIPEIIIVDDQSNDETVEICRRYTEKIIIHPLNDDFAVQRNIGIEASTKKWILQLDADEVVPPKTKQEIEKALSEGEDAVGFSLVRRNYFLGKRMRFGGWSEKSIKLSLREKGIYHGRVHETLQVSGPVKNLKAVIEHYPFEAFSDCLEKTNRYSSLDAQMMFEKNPSPSEKILHYHMKVRPIKVFWKIFVKKQGFREGFPGLVFSCLWALGDFVKWAKYWEIIHLRGHDV